MAFEEMSEKTLREKMQEETPVLVEYWAPWCSYCRRLAPALEAIGEQYAGRLIVGKVDVDKESSLALHEDITVVPTLVLYNKGERAGSVTGPGSKAEVERFIADKLGLPS